MPTIAEQKHHVPGRMRLSLPFAKRDRALLDRIRESLAGMRGIRGIATNATNATVIIHYDPAMYDEFPRMLANFTATKNLMSINIGRANNGGGLKESSTERSLEAIFGRANRVVQDSTRNAISLKEILPFGILAWSVIFVDPAAAAAQWLSWMSFAWNTYFDLHQDEPVHAVGQQVKKLQSDISAIRALLEQRSEPGRA